MQFSIAPEAKHGLVLQSTTTSDCTTFGWNAGVQLGGRFNFSTSSTSPEQCKTKTTNHTKVGGRA